MVPRTTFVAGVSVFAMLAATTAYAQESDDLDNGQVIVVTAQKREQRLIDVPMAVAVLGGEDLEQRGIDPVQDLSFAVPGLTMREDGPGSYTIFLRGLANQSGSGALVSMYLDEAPLSLSGYDQLSPVPLDFARVEVLKCPQGTPYGQGSAGGTIPSATNDPQKGLQIKENLLDRCQVCHPDASENFPTAWLSHYIPSPQNYPIVYWVNIFYSIFIPTVLGGMAILVVWLNALTAWLTLASLLGYAVVYTLYLKRATPQNIVIGGLGGAAPPLLGWTAVTGEIHGHALLLVLIIFAWTPPHFWALALHRKEEYAKADVPMLPVTHGDRYTKLHVLLYTILMVLVTLLPYLTGMSGWIYLLGALMLGGGFLYWAMRLYRSDDPALGMTTFKYSIVYLLALFAIMLADHQLIAPALVV